MPNETQVPIWHLTFSSDGRWPLFANEDALRIAVRTLARVAGRELVLFGIADDHAHIVLRGEVTRRGRIAGLALALRSTMAAPLVAPHVRPVQTRAHLLWLVRYVLTQVGHHGLCAPAALWSGSCFLDLVGGRVVEDMQLAIRELLPRCHAADYYGAVGIKQVPRLSDDALRALGPQRLIAAASATLAAPSRLEGRERVVVEARRAAARLCHQVGLPSSEIRWGLRLTRQGLAKLLVTEVAAATLNAVRVRLGLEQGATSTRESDHRPDLVVARTANRRG